MINIIHSECLEYLKNIDDNYFDTIITDPPYGIKFKNNKWDYSVPSIKYFKEFLRVIKPGGSILCFGGSRTFHRMMINMEDAGWFIKDTLMWFHNQGFPKSVDISYMIDKNRNKSGSKKNSYVVSDNIMSSKEISLNKEIIINNPYDDKSKAWFGWGTNLKPSYEPIILASKPIIGNYDDNALNYGVCGYWIDGVRVENTKNYGISRTTNGRWPTNILKDESCINSFDKNNRFHFCSKPTKKEKREYNTHPTVKPIDLMRYLCRLTKTPTGGIILDPFCGSGTTGIGALIEERSAILIDSSIESVNIAKKRISEYNKNINEIF